MFNTTNEEPAFRPEQTFKSYTQEQGKQYARGRPGANPNFFHLVVNKHTSTAGELGTVLDIGCGTGTGIRGLAPYFETALGLDASDGMIKTAANLGGTTRIGSPIRYHVSGASELGSNLDPPIADKSVDLITAATAAHWFDMSQFWPRAARILKPGGTVAIWIMASGYVHPTQPGYEAIQAAIDRLRTEHLEVYRIAGNHVARNLYVDLPLPWTIDPPVEAFDPAAFSRQTWTKADNATEDTKTLGFGPHTISIDAFENLQGTASAMTRWREAHPDAVGTEKDLARIIRRKVESILHEIGVAEGEERLIGGVEGALLIVKKRK